MYENGELVSEKKVEFYMKMIAERSMSDAYRRENFPKVYAMSTYFFQSLILLELEPFINVYVI